MAANEHELEFVRRFVPWHKQERYLGFLSAARHRRKFLGELYHRLELLGNTATELRGPDQFPAPVEEALRTRGAGAEAYFISPNRELDQRFLPLGPALLRLFETDEVAIVSCIPGRLAFFKSEDGAWILAAPAENLRGSDAGR